MTTNMNAKLNDIDSNITAIINTKLISEIEGINTDINNLRTNINNLKTK